MEKIPFFYTHNSGLLLRVSGVDSSRYLHNRLTNAINSLKDGEYTEAAALTAQGKTEGLFHVLKVSESNFKLFADTLDTEKVREALLRFKVADQFDVESSTCSIIYAYTGEKAPLLDPSSETSHVFKSGHNEGLQVIYASVSSIESVKQYFLAKGFKEITAEDSTATRVTLNVPLLDREIFHTTNFMETPYRHMISFGTGCYVGQEVVERTDALGKAAKRILPALFHGENVSAGEKVFSKDLEKPSIGTVLSASPQEGKVYCFIRVKETEHPLIRTETVEGELLPILK